MRQCRWLELLADYDCEIRYHLGKANVVAVALKPEGTNQTIEMSEAIWLTGTTGDSYVEAYDSIRWDYLLDVLDAFGFGNRWCKWIRGSLMSATASILANGSPSNDSSYRCDSGLFKGIHFPGSLAISHLFYADDALFVGLSVNIQKCQLLGVWCCHKTSISRSFLLLNRLSKWKEKTLSIGGRLTLLKAVLGASPVYSMSLFKVPLGVLNIMEGIRNRFFNGNGKSESKITWIAWNKVLCSKKMRALAIYGTRIDEHPLNFSSNWCAIVNEVRSLNVKGIDLWYSPYVLVSLGIALEEDKDVSVAVKLGSSVCSSFRRDPRGGDGVFSVKALRNFIDDKILPSHPEATNWVKNIPIKVNIFNWRARRDCLPTRLNLAYRGVVLESTICPVCKHAVEDIKHILFRCDLARSVLRRVCRWWGLDQQDWSSFLDWHNWFSSTRLPSANKELLEGVFYTAWWILWNFRNKCVPFRIILPGVDSFDDLSF
ncbi:RNA-directed DNA polymerase, eukaryota [Tanacetum coccineum]